MNYLGNRPKMYFKLYCNVLDELYNQLPGEIDRDKAIKCKLEHLSDLYKGLSNGAKIEYADPITRWAYIILPYAHSY